MRNDEKISRHVNYCNDKFIHQVYFGYGDHDDGITKLSHFKLLKKFKNYDDAYNCISEAKSDIATFSIEAYIEKSSMSRYRYERYHSNKFSSMANCDMES